MLTFYQIRVGGHETIAELIQATGLSRPSGNSLVLELVDMGWVEVADPEPDGHGGRPAQRFRFRAEVGHLIGLDIGVHRVSAVITDLAGRVLAGQKTDVSPAARPTERLRHVHGVIDKVLSQGALSAQDIWAVGAAVTGPVDADGRTSMSTPLPGWGEVDLSSLLRGTFSCPIRVQNDVKLALQAEHEWGAARGVEDVVLVLAGQRTGAASMVNGQIVGGFGGAAGEIGALPAVRWRDAIEQLYRLPGIPETLRESERAGWVFEQAQRMNAQAQELVWKYARDVATGAAAVVLTIDPQVVVVGGGSTQWSSLWIAEFSATLNKSVVRMPEVRVSEMGGDHVARGAGLLAQETVEKALFDTVVEPVQRPSVA